YMDNAATTSLLPEVLDAMMPYLTSCYGSASTLYSIGREAAAAVEEARKQVASLINAKYDEEIYFTSCGSESDNWAIRGACDFLQKKGRHIITTAVEHHAVMDTFKYLQKKGWETTVLPVDSLGRVTPEQVAEAIRPDTVLVSVMHANNEIGTIMPVNEIGGICAEKGIHFHVDAVQTAGHIPVDVQAMNCSSLALSAHKFHGPKGVGALYIKKGKVCRKFIHGGAQENNLRAGTHNVAGIVGMGKAAEIGLAEYASEAKRLTVLRDALIKGIKSGITECSLNGDPENRLPNNVNFIFKGIEGESIILFLDMKGICASSGSACTSGTLDPSYVLLAIGLKHEQAHGSLRLTLGRETTQEQVDYVLHELPPIVERLRQMSPLYNK
ncbi:MAG: cysteine desulfurase NifS, partial [Abditibacteriota bacterium]|nr:cysteine desulfurase NifS [Abditibacteriota bacterium]